MRPRVPANLNDEYALIAFDQGALHIKDGHPSEMARDFTAPKVVEYEPSVHERLCRDDLNRLSDGFVTHDNDIVVAGKLLIIHDAVNGHKGVMAKYPLDLIHLGISEVVEA